MALKGLGRKLSKEPGTPPAFTDGFPMGIGLCHTCKGHWWVHVDFGTAVPCSCAPAEVTAENAQKLHDRICHCGWLKKNA
jgi:hypothetical protein